MIRVVWNGVVLAEAPQTVQLEGNHYFPAESLHREYLQNSSTTTRCPWKGRASYYTIVVDGTAQSGRRLVLPQTQPLGAQDQRSRGVLAWSARRGAVMLFDPGEGHRPATW